jgi:hypothetical protein
LGGTASTATMVAWCRSMATSDAIRGDGFFHLSGVPGSRAHESQRVDDGPVYAGDTRCSRSPTGRASTTRTSGRAGRGTPSRATSGFS